MSYFDGKTVLLTGANGGLGSEMARQLGATSARLVLTDLGPKPVVEHGGVVRYVQADISSREGCEALLGACRDAAPAIDVLINNAGIASVGDFVDVPDEAWERQIDVNLVAPMRLTRRLLPAMIARRSGHVVNVSSVGGHVGMPRTATYAATKWGLRGFGIALRGEVEAHGVCVSTVYPTFTRTPILDADRYGPRARGALPAFLVDRPDAVVRATLAGVARREAHIFPSASARASAALARLSPRLMRALLGRLVAYVD